MKSILFGLVLFAASFSFSQMPEPVQTRTLKATDGTIIRLTYRLTFHRDTSYKPTNVYTADDVQVYVVRPSNNNSGNVTFVLMNFNKFESVPMTYELKSLQVAGLASYHWAPLSKAAVSKSYIQYPNYQPLVVHESGYGGEFSYHQEIAVVIDDQWLVDPINGTHNFKLNLYK